MKTVAILPASGIGDALLMMIAAHQFKQAGYLVSTYHPHLPQLSHWFPSQQLKAAYTSLDELASYDLILVENDNSTRVIELISVYRNKMCIFYPTYKAEKNAALHPLDQSFNASLPMATNMSLAVSALLNKFVSKENGITPPAHLNHRINLKQILIHPSSSSAKKNWLSSHFLKLARLLKQRHFTPVFVVSPGELSQWKWITEKGYLLITPTSLSDLADLIYESSAVISNDSLAGHLASNLQIPNLVIADCAERLKLWRPDWLTGSVLTPPHWLPRWIKKRYWAHCISSKYVFKHLLILLESVR